ncbi:hypothetical protein L226DRAFT_562885 [Lentinus tigrinus ALCF2SS1-7]|uniref:Uncharacterized protein n=1 Tax=Lentinus tigrinus ALCF2SS1-6 TaxID=1328759 RepID=A0A5C2RUW7_9APHY|nr:hypothetical protein L227DRAFT_603691 [Lentinus tigrinus ALCF2SS1-6]RPD70364.1 hypothetical protein L226DRAFT_562885 [Lentinus tigrinus ALCF2SS1-7]
MSNSGKAAAQTEYRSSSRTERAISPAAAGGIEWVACDLPPWACRSCQQKLAEQGRGPGTRHGTPSGSHPPSVAGVDRGTYPSIDATAASTSTRNNAQHSDDHTVGASRGTSINREGSPKAHRANGHRRSSNIATDDAAADGYASEGYASSTTSDEVDSAADDPDWEENASTSTVRHSAVYDDDDPTARESSLSADTGSEEEYKPYRTKQKRTKTSGRPTGKAAKRSRRG